VSPIPKSRRNPKLIIAERDRVPVAVEGGTLIENGSITGASKSP
jgi:hypothetical protein